MPNLDETDKVIAEAQQIFDISGIVPIFTGIADQHGFQVHQPTAIYRPGNITETTGLAIMARSIGGGSDHYGGQQVWLVAEPPRHELSVRSSLPPAEFLPPPYRDPETWRKLEPTVLGAVQRAFKHPANFYWYEGLVGEETDLK